MCVCVFAFVRVKEKLSRRGTGEAICIKRLITCRVNQPCSLSATELRETPGDNQRGEERRGEGGGWGGGWGSRGGVGERLKWREGRKAYSRDIVRDINNRERPGERER